MRMAFVSRHKPTKEQEIMAEAEGFELSWLGDMDAFKIDARMLLDHGKFDAVAVVHPAAAMRLAPYFLIGVFENANRAAEDEAPRFEAVALHVFDLME